MCLKCELDVDFDYQDPYPEQERFRPSSRGFHSVCGRLHGSLGWSSRRHSHFRGTSAWLPPPSLRPPPPTVIILLRLVSAGPLQIQQQSISHHFLKASLQSPFITLFHNIKLLLSLLSLPITPHHCPPFCKGGCPPL